MMADASEDPDLYVKRQVLAIERWREKVIMRKAQELVERRYLDRDDRRYFGFMLTEKGKAALREHVGDPADSPSIVYKDDLVKMAQEAGTHYPEECCGLMVAKDSDTKVIPCINIQTDLHKLHPKLFHKDGHTAFAMHPEEVQAVKVEYLDKGWRLAAIYHSHVEVPPVFSKDDFLKAMHDGKPLFPGTDYLILGITKQDPPPEAINHLGAYRWNQSARLFLPVKAEIHERNPIPPTSM
jgi:proteasome lid subunit RPN8/RPN11